MTNRIPTLYEWAGDMETFERLFSSFYDKVLKDDLLGEVFKNMSQEHVKHVSHFVAEVFGGPALYTAEDNGSHAAMVGKHIGKMLTEEKRRRWIHLLLQTADEQGWKSDPEFRSAFVGYLEWGSRIAVINSQLEENPMQAAAPMPKWGWGETGGPYIKPDAQSNYILETERLYLREITIEDAENAYRLNLDPEVIRYTGDEAFESVEEARDFLSRYDHYQKYGFGRWGVILKETGEFIGWCGLKYTPELDEYDIGFRFFKKYWNNGYATESAKACIQLGFEKYGMRSIAGRAMKENTASIHVLEKLGLVYDKTILTDGHEEVIYKIEAEE